MSGIIRAASVFVDLTDPWREAAASESPPAHMDGMTHEQAITRLKVELGGRRDWQGLDELDARELAQKELMQKGGGG